ncbi:MAG: metallophosphoesterase family protein, partial [Smithellaceae bacterium]|nr:metallophosphoesterase family protein [Smithellaceae bacterium]
QRLGLMADSHGDLHILQRAIDLLRAQGAELLVHLGDFCDSLRPETLADIIGILQTNGVLAVRGNNEYALERTIAAGRGDKGDNPTSLFLRSLPFHRTMGDITFAHSFPGDDPRGLYEPIDAGGTNEAATLFGKTTQRLLFAGHSHRPVLFRRRHNQIAREEIRPGESVHLPRNERAIIIVGALENGEAGIYDQKSDTYESKRISP